MKFESGRLHLRVMLKLWLPIIVVVLGGAANIVAEPTIAAALRSDIHLAVLTSGLNLPVCIANAGDDRLFVVEKGGRIRIILPGGADQPTPFLDITARVGSSGTEQGLLGLVFHPNYSSNGFFYVNYTDLNGDTHIVRFSVSAADPNLADPNSEELLIFVSQPFANHNGGDLQFGPDGYLYLGLGDGGSGGDPGNRAQSGATLLGKLLRIDVDHGSPYAIPPTNPFVGNPAFLGEIWALGLRNPWRFSFDRLTGDLWIADVGQNLWEEIDWQPVPNSGGQNYGWRCYEAMAPYNLDGCGASSTYVFPLVNYGHNLGCAVTGGYRYRGRQFPSLYGSYFFADFCTGTIWSLAQDGLGNWQTAQSAAILQLCSTFGEDANGELYMADYQNGIIYQVLGSDTATATPTPFRTSTATMTPANSPFPTPTPPSSCTTTGAYIQLPSHLFRPGDPCWVNIYVCNAETFALSNYPLYAVLDVFGVYYCGPSFTTARDDYLAQHPSFPPGLTTITVLPPFAWPAGFGNQAGIWFYAALVNPAGSSVLGQVDAWEFGWSN